MQFIRFSFSVFGGERVTPYQILNVAPNATKDQIRAAYRALARRWHPDRFPEGPEREWASDHMCAINAAYRACMDGPAGRAPEDERRQLEEVEHLIFDGQYTQARTALMAFTTRSAEWNYLFGSLLMQLRETEKALIYLRVAAHQNPESAKYASALSAAREQGSLQTRLRSRFHR